MYNETAEFLLKTLYGLFKNLKHFKEIGISNEQIAVVVVCDGMFTIHPSLKKFIEEKTYSENQNDMTLMKKRQQLSIDFLSMMIFYAITEQFKEKNEENLAMFFRASLKFVRNSSKNRNGYGIDFANYFSAIKEIVNTFIYFSNKYISNDQKSKKNNKENNFLEKIFE